MHSFTKGFVTSVIVGSLYTFAGGPGADVSPQKEALDIEFTTIAEGVPGYAAFQSHNQKVVSNRHGIFVAYLSDHKELDGKYYTRWTLVRSIDGGQSFFTIYESNGHTKPPSVETDQSGRVYVIHPVNTPGCQTCQSRFLRFDPEKGFLNPLIKDFSHAGEVWKFTTYYDHSRDLIYYMHWSNSNPNFFVLNTSGRVLRSAYLAKNGPKANVQYPLLTMGGGTLFAAWTTALYDRTHYWDIHFMMSEDGGLSWKKTNGAHLNLPVIADHTGPTEGIILKDEYEVNTWLSNMIYYFGSLHFMYGAQTVPYRQHHVKFRIGTRTEKRNGPEWKGNTVSLANLDGFFSVDPTGKYPGLYAISRTVDQKLGVLISETSGETWEDYALEKSDLPSDHMYYSITGARDISYDGYIYGIYVAQRPGTTNNSLRFFRIKALTAK